MPGEAEADEPFLVKQAGGLFHQLNTAAVVFDEVVVGGYEIGNTRLLVDWRKGQRDTVDVSDWQLWLCNPASK